MMISLINFVIDLYHRLSNVTILNRFSHDVELPSLPEMVFPGNSLQLEHAESGCVLEFLALEALKLVENTHDPLKVPVAEEWSRTQ
jgi:type 2A phosphatase activator TIP41